MREYDAIADWYASERADNTGVSEALAAIRSLPPGARILDVGCGNGVPITRALLEAGYRVVGLDSSSRMLARFRTNLPDTPVIRGLAEYGAFADSSFDGVVAWGIMFHLTRKAQKSAVASLARVLRPGAPFLFTSGGERPHPTIPPGVGDDAEGIQGTMNGVVFRYYSFDADAYRSLLRQNGLTLVDVVNVVNDSSDNTYYLARKAGC